MVMAIGWIAPTRASTMVVTVVRRTARMSSLIPGSTAVTPPKSAASAVWMSDTMIPTMKRMPSVRHQLSRTRFQLRPNAFTGPTPSADHDPHHDRDGHDGDRPKTDKNSEDHDAPHREVAAEGPQQNRTDGFQVARRHRRRGPVEGTDAEWNEQGGDRKTEEVERRAGVLRLPGLDLRELVRVVDVLQDTLQEIEWVGPVGAGDQAEDQVGEDDHQRHARDHREMATIQLEGLVQ